ncbi:MAG: HEAT repeat domain-containing protein [Planctomycetaceae bacterium]|nr:HEAT repeat domain-containing protein [Planctomycetaceae bacterium]
MCKSQENNKIRNDFSEMDVAGKIIVLITGLLFIFAGCSLTVPVERLHFQETAVLSPTTETETEISGKTETLTDPFLTALSNELPPDPFMEHLSQIVPVSHVVPQNKQNSLTSSSEIEPVGEAEPITKTETFEAELITETEPAESDSAPDSVPASEPESEPESESDGELVTDEEQERILAKDIWTKNIVLDYWKENGMKNPFPNQNEPDRKRRDEINRLNMSNKEIQKQNNFNYEYSSGLPSTWRWFHREMELLIRIPPELRGTPEMFLHNKKYQGTSYRVLRANAAILLGRDGDTFAEKELVETVKNGSLKNELRCAAAETLGRLPTVLPDVLIPLLEQFKEREVETINKQTGLSVRNIDPGIPALWLELLIGLAERLEPWEHPCFLEPFSARNFEIRWQTAKLWRQHSPPKKRNGTSVGGWQFRLPEAYLDYVRRETNPTIRTEMIRTLGLWKEPEIWTFVQHDLNGEVMVRHAAMIALAEAGCREAVPVIKQKLHDSVASNRAKAAEALRKLGCLEEVFPMADDQDSNVRLEVVKAFANRCSPQTVALARRMINDYYEKVRLATLEALAQWSLEESGLILLEAAKSQHVSTRRQALEILAKHGIAVKDLNPLDLPKNQTEQYERLVRCFHEAVGSSEVHFREGRGDGFFPSEQNRPNDLILDEIRYCLNDWQRPDCSPEERKEIRNRFTSFGEQLLPALNYLYEFERRKIPKSLDSVLAESNPVFEWIVQLKSDDMSERRKAASALARWSSVRGADRLALRRIEDQANHQTDFFVLGSLLEVIRKSDSELAKQLAATLLRSESLKLRSLACEIFQEFGDGHDLPKLMELLGDPNWKMFQSSLNAVLGIFERAEFRDFEGERAEIIEKLESRLLRGDMRFQLEAAAALHRLGDPVGEETFRRLALSSDSRIRCEVAQKVAELGDTVFIPVLIYFLDDRSSSVRMLALSGLPKLAGEEIEILDFGRFYSNETSVTQQKITRWKKWASYRNDPANKRQ